jgi:hypothetical protein
MDALCSKWEGEKDEEEEEEETGGRKKIMGR